MADADRAYIGVSACGCVTAALVAGYMTKREEKAELKRWMKTGRRVELTTAGEARERLNFACKHDKAPTDQQKINEEAERLVMEARNA